MKNFIIVILRKHFVIDIIEDIDLQNDLFIAIEMTKYKNSDDRFLETMKDFVTNFDLLKKSIFHDQFIHTFDDFREISYETFVEITEI